MGKRSVRPANAIFRGRTEFLCHNAQQMDSGFTRASSSRRIGQGVVLVFLAMAAGIYLFRVPEHPPGFAIDESSICYNAFTISQTGADEQGSSWPLFFRAFGEYKNPTLIYVLAAIFKITGPSIAVARSLTASFGVLTGVLLGLLAWQITRKMFGAIVVAVTALFTPWLYESSRLVFEVAIYPALVALFLLFVWRASLRARWKWSDIVALSASLALLTYSYSIGRLLAPLLALGLAWFVSRERWRGIVATWILYGASLIPLLVFHLNHPGALTNRFKAITYFKAGDSTAAAIAGFAKHYFANINPWRWLVIGEGDIRDHLQGMGSLLAVSVVLAVFGLAIVLRQHRQDAWWRFVIYSLLVSPVPASLTTNPFPQLRLVAFPIFFLVLMIPAVSWLDQARTKLRGVGKRPWLTGALLLVISQGLIFQWRYHKGAPGLWYVFDARFPRKVLAPALATGQFPIFLRDEPGQTGYIHALWYGVLAGLDPGRFTRLLSGQPPPAGAVVISTGPACTECRLMARSLNYIVYSVPPYRENALQEKKPITVFAANILCENPPGTLSAGQPVTLRFLIRNISNAEWPATGNAEGKGAVFLQSRWRTETGEIVPGHETEKSVPYDVEPGDTIGLTLEVTPPEQGGYLLEVDLLQKEIARFSEHGSSPWTGNVTVTAKR